MVMRRAIVLAIGLSACAGLQPPKPPEPKRFTMPMLPSTVVQSVARVLVADGFDITTSDANAGVIAAQRQRGPKQQPEYLTCVGHPNSLATQGRTTTLRVNVSAVGNGSGSEITIRTSVRSEYRGDGLEANDRDCVSSGKTEAAIAAAVGYRIP